MQNDDVREVKSKLSIVDVVGDYVALRKNGRTHWGKCPFHTEKTPSFSVSEERQTFHCFGCGEGGDVFTFVMKIENVEFREALERLAERAGVRLVKTNPANSRKQKAFGDVNVAALDFYKESLAGRGGEAARAYLARRSITARDAKYFEIGWAPSSWDALLLRLKDLGFQENDILESGLAVMGNRGPYDRFRGRVMFPIYNAADKLIGFGGRILDGDGAKYLNSPESPLFNKRNNLYLLNKAKSEIRTQGSAILVEGYMDAIRAHMKGFTNTVASLGTALTDTQASLIKRMTDLCYICYDSDSAGQEAALRGMYVLQRQGVSVRVMRLSEDKDPDDVLSKDGGDALFRQAMEQAIPLPVYHALLRSEDLKTPEKAVSAREDLLEGLASLSPFDLLQHMNRLGQILGMFPHDLQREIDGRQEKVRGRDTRKLPEDDGRDAEPETIGIASEEECRLCSLFWNDEDLRSLYSLEDVVPFLDDDAAKNIISALLMGENHAELESRWRQIGDKKSLNLIAKGNGLIDSELADQSNLAQTASKIVDNLRRKCIEKRLMTLQRKLKTNIATDEEFQEHLRLTKILKGGYVKR